MGLQLTQPVISTMFSEMTPVDPNGGTPRIGNLQAVTRTPLSLGVQLNLLIQRGTARVLADPRITTISGRAATIRAGDTIGILTTAGGGVGTAITTQLQTFQTGVTLDITPIVAGDDVTVALHPVVNNLSGIINGVPQISTRDAQDDGTPQGQSDARHRRSHPREQQPHREQDPGSRRVPGVGRIFRNSRSTRRATSSSSW